MHVHYFKMKKKYLSLMTFHYKTLSYLLSRSLWDTFPEKKKLEQELQSQDPSVQCNGHVTTTAVVMFL